MCDLSGVKVRKNIGMWLGCILPAEFVNKFGFKQFENQFLKLFSLNVYD